jgi:aspartate/methionine/tyrosine aminotransferase
MNNTLKFNPAFEGLEPSSTLFVNETVNRLWQQGEQVFHMGFGESRFDVHPTLQSALAAHANKKSYLPAKGLPQLLDAVAGYYSSKLETSFSSSQVLIGPGSKSLIYGLQMVLDADVFLTTPSWVSYGPQAQLLGNKFQYIPSNVEDNYRLDIGALDAMVKASNNPCKMLIINSPNNPTGEVMSDSFLQELATYCRANDIWVLSDEIYFQVCHGDVEHVSISKYYPEGTFVLGGLSKHFSIGGWRVGVALLPDTELGKQLMQKMVLFASETWSGVSAPIQYAAIDAYLQHKDVERYVADCRDIHGIRTRFIRSGLVAMGITCTSAKGGFYIAANFDKHSTSLRKLGIHNAADLSKHLLQEYRIATLPGSDFGIPTTTYTLRLSTSYLDMETDIDPQRIFDVYKGGSDESNLMSLENHPATHAALAAFASFMQTLG